MKSFTERRLAIMPEPETRLASAIQRDHDLCVAMAKEMESARRLLKSLLDKYAPALNRISEEPQAAMEVRNAIAQAFKECTKAAEQAEYLVEAYGVHVDDEKRK